MWDTLVWWKRLRNPDLLREVDHLRQGTLSFLIILTAAVYVAWHIVRVPIDGSAEQVMEHGLRHWALFSVAAAGLGCTILLQRRQARWAATCFLVASALSIVAAVWILRTPDALVLLPLLMLTAIVLMQPLTGLMTGFATLGALVALWASGPLAFVDPSQLVRASIISCLTLVVAWALGRTIVTVIEASSISYDEARRHAQEARANRAELVQALKQLDIAYYQLRRANASLELAWKAADAAERSKSEFVTNISHELRTPLSLIAGFSEMILTSPESYGEPLPTPYRGDLHAIYRSAQHLLALSNDVIDLARVSMDRLALDREMVLIDEIIHDACAIVRDYVETKGLTLRLHTEPNLPMLFVDRLRIRQVLLNLLTNAARFTEQGGIAVSATRTGESVTVAVADTGAGMPADQLPKIFEEFYHDAGDLAPPTEQLGGIGLGLPLSKRLIDLHGGQMAVESAPGDGATFSFRLPIRTGQAPLSIHPPSRGDEAERILVYAAPDRQFLDFLQRHLTGYEIIAAPACADAIMTASAVRALGILAATQDTATTACDAAPLPIMRLPMPAAEQFPADAKVVAYLVKPIARADLHEALNQVEGSISSVLIVDDDRRFVRLLRRMLETSPHQPIPRVRVAYDGRAALNMMTIDRPDLVLLDLEMPEFDGARLLGSMVSDPQLANVPTIIISAHDRFLEGFPLRGALSMIKPDGLRPEEMLRLIDSFFTALEPPRPPTASPTGRR